MIVAKWQTRSGKQYVQIERLENNLDNELTPYRISAPGAGGVDYAINDDTIIERIHNKIDMYFTDNIKYTSIHRVA